MLARLQTLLGAVVNVQSEQKSGNYRLYVKPLSNTGFVCFTRTSDSKI